MFIDRISFEYSVGTHILNSPARQRAVQDSEKKINLPAFAFDRGVSMEYTQSTGRARSF